MKTSQAYYRAFISYSHRDTLGSTYIYLRQGPVCQILEILLRAVVTWCRAHRAETIRQSGNPAAVQPSGIEQSEAEARSQVAGHYLPTLADILPGLGQAHKSRRMAIKGGRSGRDEGKLEELEKMSCK